MYKRIFIIVILIIGFGASSLAQSGSASEYLEKFLLKRSELSHSSTKKFNTEEQKVLDDLLENLRTAYPDSYQYFLATYIHNGYDNANKNNLFKAYDQAPENGRVLKNMLAYYVINDDVLKRIEFVKKTDDLYSKNQWDYYRDLIQSTKKGIIITSGQDDMFPLMASSMLYGIGSNIDFICLDFLKHIFGDFLFSKVKPLPKKGRHHFLL